MEIEWICTDTDTNQYGRKITDTVYEFKEFRHQDYFINTVDYPDASTFIDTVWDNSVYWVQVTIDLAEYSEEEIKHALTAFGYEDESNWIKAECLFEVNFTDFL